jgi:asparaginyl-tRNA synthetase
MEKIIEKLRDEKTATILKIQSRAIKSIIDFMYDAGVTQLMPVLLSPITDPLNHSVYDASIEYCGEKLQLTKSMILHKQMALLGEKVSSIFVVSPCVRLEKPDEVVGSGRHLIEFSQVDIEFKDMTKVEFMRFMEKLIIHVLSDAKKYCSEELKFLGRELLIPMVPFKIYESKELEAEHGPDFEKIVSKATSEPFWILDHTREFYDKEDPERKGYYHNYDLVWPEGFGEALSGAERDFKHEILVRKMKERDMDLSSYEAYLSLAKKGLLRATAGGGLGVERLVRFLTGAKVISDVTLFPRSPGEKILV